jgi:hypothetical protein
MSRSQVWDVLRLVHQASAARERELRSTFIGILSCIMSLSYQPAYTLCVSPGCNKMCRLRHRIAIRPCDEVASNCVNQSGQPSPKYRSGCLQPDSVSRGLPEDYKPQEACLNPNCPARHPTRDRSSRNSR